MESQYVMLKGVDNYFEKTNNRGRLAVLLFATFLLGVVD